MVCLGEERVFGVLQKDGLCEDLVFLVLHLWAY